MKEFISSILGDKRKLSIAAIVVIAGALILTVFVAQKQQEIRQRAAGEQAEFFFSTGTGCSNRVTTTTFPPGATSTLNLCLNTNFTGVSVAKGFDVTIAKGNGVTLSTATVGVDGAKLGNNAFNTILADGSLRYARVDQNGASITGAALNLGTITLTAASTGTGNISMTKSQVIDQTGIAELTVAKPTLNYTISQQSNSCSNDSQCVNGETCVSGTCVASTPKNPPCRVPSSLGGGVNDWYGDVDGDGKITNNDVLQVLNYVAHLPTTPTFGSLQIEKADVNGQPNIQSSSSNVDSTDALMIASYLNNRNGVTTFTACPASLTPTSTPTPAGNSISGIVFVDTNGNGIKDTGEIGYNSQGSNIMQLHINIGPGSTQLWGLTATGTDGIYTFPNLPAGNYRLIMGKPSGYTETTPGTILSIIVPTSNTYNFGIRLASAITPTPTTAPIPNCNGGGSCTSCVSNQSNTCNGSGSQTCTYTTYNGSTLCNTVTSNVTCNTAPPNCSSGYTCDASKVCVANPSATPTPTATPNFTPVPRTSPTPTTTPTPGQGGTTQIALKIGLDSIGSVGDSTNPDPSASTKDPQHKTRNIVVVIYDGSEHFVSGFDGTVQYNSTTGIFTGTVVLGQTPSGNYIVKIKSLGYLQRRLPGITALVSGETYNANQVNLVVGDLNGDNRMDIADYNILNDCIFAPAATHGTVCSQNPAYADMSDLNDNGIKNILDYSLFVRELIVRDGD